MSRRNMGGLRAVACFKLVKAALVIAMGIGALQLLQPSMAQRLQQWILDLSIRPGLRFIAHALGAVGHLDRSKMTAIGVGALAYGLLFTVEGVGLWMGKRWAEWLTIVATGSFVPFEILELAKEFTPFRLFALIANVAVVAYLVYRVRHDK